ncbi:MAG: multicopper oxidase family protein [Actinobacteria bacterium]|nr:multicopper oxidase family protein [Actinomycetota bacterium]
MPELTRRALLTGAAGAASVLALDACTRGGGGAAATGGASVGPAADVVAAAEAARRSPGQQIVKAGLVARPGTVDLGGMEVATWTFNGRLPGPVLRAKAGDLMQVTVDNGLPAPTSVHWHGVALRNDMDGVPDVTQPAIAQGGRFHYEFTVPDPGTYFYHPHVGLQLDRGLYGVLIVDDPADPGRRDAEWIVVLDDWVDGTGRTPDDVLAALGGGMAGGGGHDMGSMPGMGGDPSGGMGGGTGSTGSTGGGMGGGMGGGTGSTPGTGGGMGGSTGGGMGGMSGEEMTSPLIGGVGDVRYPYYLLNGRVPDAPASFTARPGQRVRLRIVNAGGDTTFRVALGGHRLTVTHTDGYPVQPVVTDSLLIGMGERVDVEVTLDGGIFPLVALAEGKDGMALGLVRTGAGRPPDAVVRPVELNRRVLLANQARATEQVRLPDRTPDRRHDLVLTGSMGPYQWMINGALYPHTPPLPVRQGERVRLRFSNRSMMSHPMHLHGHTFAVVGTGTRKDTVLVPAMRSIEVDFDADNPGQWMTHCHNVYHAERGMMVVVSYRS